MVATDGFAIRPYRPADHGAVVALWAESALTADYNPPAVDIALCAATPSAELFVGASGDDVVATIMAGNDGHRGWLYYLAVDTAHRRQGRGGAMVAHAERWLRDQGVRKVQLMIRSSNPGVRKFYERVGYEDNPCPIMQRWLVDRSANAGPGRV